MYTRNFGKQKYTPPPGYDGTAFGGILSTKHHEPTELIRSDERLPEPVEVQITDMEPPETEIQPEITQHELADSPFRQLLDSIRGKFGTEELIILLVMLLIASDGFGAEMLMLGILLAVGN
jgi:hypothetical protein